MTSPTSTLRYTLRTHSIQTSLELTICIYWRPEKSISINPTDVSSHNEVTAWMTDWGKCDSDTTNPRDGRHCSKHSERLYVLQRPGPYMNFRNHVFLYPCFLRKIGYWVPYSRWKPTFFEKCSGGHCQTRYKPRTKQTRLHLLKRFLCSADSLAVSHVRTSCLTHPGPIIWLQGLLTLKSSWTRSQK